MRICQIVPWFPSKNPSTLESRLGIFECREVIKLSGKGHKFKIISIKWKGQLNHEIINSNIEVHRIPLLFSIPKIRYPIPNFVALTRLICKINSEWIPEIFVYGHMDYLTALPVIYLRNMINVPVIVTIDGLTGLNWFYNNVIVDTIGYIHSISLARWIFKSADGIRFLSHELNNFASFFGISTDKVYTIPRGVDTRYFRPITRDNAYLKSDLSIEINKTVILYVGRIDGVKGVNYLLEAAKKIIEINKDVIFLIVGDGNLKKEYELSVGIFSNNIFFLGYRDDIPKIMNSSDIFVLPSLSEGAANVVVEASSSGLPVIASNVGEIPQIILDGETGILIKPSDVDSLFNALKTLVENPTLAKKMGKAGRKRIEENFSWEIICGEIESAYNDSIRKYNHL